MQTVFRLRPRPRPRIPNQQNYRGEDVGPFRPRRAHRKSRNGCQNCKRRRVKCDEKVEFGCRNCQRHGIDCDYVASSAGPTDIAVESNEHSPRSLTPTSALTRRFSTVTPLYASPGPVSPLGDQQPADLAPALQMLSFFETFTCSTVTTIDGLSIFKDSILALSHQRDYLMHAILGMAAAHLRAIDGIMENQQQSQRYSKTESYHWHHAIRQYRAELANEASSEHADSLITTSMLVSLHSFQVAGPTDPR